MSGYISSDLMSTSPGNAVMTSPVSNPGRPILESASSSNYSSIDQQQQNSQEKNTNTNAPTVNFRGPTFSYEELSSGLTCPTCQGTGKIPRGQEDDLVALIPYGDKRLKPPRTWLYVFLSFSLCVILAGVLSAFLIPRSIVVVHDNVTTMHVDLNVTEDRCFLELKSTYNVTNNNFVSVTTNDIEVQVTVLFYKLIILNQKFIKDEKVSIRATEQITEQLNMTLTKKFFPISYCKATITRDNFVYMKFQTTFNFTLMTQTDQQVVTEYFRVNCSPDVALNGDGSPVVQSISYDKLLETYDKNQDKNVQYLF